jgi:hypothetical protein
MGFKKQTAKQTFEILATHKKNYALNPTEILKITIENMERLANRLMTEEMQAKEKNFIAKHVGSDWWEMAQKLYPIVQNAETNMYVVTSEAKEWTEGKEWEFTYKYEALEKVQQLVLWKHLDRKRGTGNVEKDLEKFAAKFAVEME